MAHLDEVSRAMENWSLDEHQVRYPRLPPRVFRVYDTRSHDHFRELYQRVRHVTGAAVLRWMVFLFYGMGSADTCLAHWSPPPDFDLTAVKRHLQHRCLGPSVCPKWTALTADWQPFIPGHPYDYLKNFGPHMRSIAGLENPHVGPQVWA